MGLFSAENSGYQQAYQNYLNAMNNYKESARQNTGERGYNQSLQMASKGADLVGGQAGNQAAKQYRAAGMSKGAAAAMGGTQGAAGYQNAFQGQQQNAMNQQSNAVTAAGNAVNQQGQATQMQQQEGQNAYNRAWGNVGNTLGIIGSFIKPASDSRLKVATKISAEKCRDKIGSILERHNTKRDYRDLMVR